MVTWVIAAVLWGLVAIGRSRGRAQTRAQWREARAAFDAERAARQSQGAQPIRVVVRGRPGDWIELGQYEVERSSLPQPAPVIDAVHAGIRFEDDRGHLVELAPDVPLDANVRVARSVKVGPGLDGTRFRYEIPATTALWIVGVSQPVADDGAYRASDPPVRVLAPVHRDNRALAYRVSDDPTAFDDAPGAPRFCVPWVILGGAVSGAIVIAMLPPVLAGIANVLLALLAWYRQWELDA